VDERTAKIDIARAGGSAADGANCTTDYCASARANAGHGTDCRARAGADQAA
jgi:hypothetical protein